MQTRNAPHPLKDQLLGLDRLTNLVDLSPSTVYRLIKAGKFPRPWKVAGRSLWSSGDIDAWMDALRTDEASR